MIALGITAMEDYWYHSAMPGGIKLLAQVRDPELVSLSRCCRGVL
jgi:hypothetical protein